MAYPASPSKEISLNNHDREVADHIWLDRQPKAGTALTLDECIEGTDIPDAEVVDFTKVTTHLGRSPRLIQASTVNEAYFSFRRVHKDGTITPLQAKGFLPKVTMPAMGIYFHDGVDDAFALAKASRSSHRATIAVPRMARRLYIALTEGRLSDEAISDLALTAQGEGEAELRTLALETGASSIVRKLLPALNGAAPASEK